MRRNQFLLIADLTKLMLQHSTREVPIRKRQKKLKGLKAQFQLDTNKDYNQIVLQCSNLMLVFERSADSSILENREAFNQVLSNMVDIFHCLVLAKNSTTEVFSSRLISTLTFTKPFIILASHSQGLLHPSRRLMELIRDELDVNQMAQLRRTLSSLLKVMPELTPLHTCTTLALEWVTDVETPPRLQDLARRALISAMSHKCLYEQAVASLGLPASFIKRCVLLHTE